MFYRRGLLPVPIDAPASCDRRSAGYRSGAASRIRAASGVRLAAQLAVRP